MIYIYFHANKIKIEANIKYYFSVFKDTGQNGPPTP